MQRGDEPASRFPGKEPPARFLRESPNPELSLQARSASLLTCPHFEERTKVPWGRQGKTWPRLAGRTLGLCESEFTQLGLVYQKYWEWAPPYSPAANSRMFSGLCRNISLENTKGRGGEGKQALWQAAVARGGCAAARKLATRPANVFPEPQAVAGRAAGRLQPHHPLRRFLQEVPGLQTVNHLPKFRKQVTKGREDQGFCDSKPRALSDPYGYSRPASPA